MNFKCSHCNQPLDADADMEGQSIQCPSCGRFILVPVSAKSFTATVRAVNFEKERSPAQFDEPQKVIVTNINMSIGDLFIFFLKCIVAWIPIAIMLSVLAMLVSLLLVGSCTSALMGTMPHP